MIHFYLVAFGSFVAAHAFPEALKTMNRILEIDQKTNRESIELLGERLKILCGKGTLTNKEEACLVLVVAGLIILGCIAVVLADPSPFPFDDYTNVTVQK